MAGLRNTIEKLLVEADSGAQNAFRHVLPVAVGDGAPIEIHVCHGLELRWPGFAFLNGELIDAPGVHPEHLRRWRAENPDADASRHSKARGISDVSLVLPLAGYDVYGHWILDFLPRAWLFTEAFGYGEKVDLVIPWDTPAFALQMLDLAFPMPNARVVRYGLTELIRLETAIVPSALHEDYRFHPAMNRFVAHLQDVAGALPPPVASKLFVSRASLVDSKRPRNSRLANEAELRAVLEADGFLTVEPEKLSWSQQISLFSQARVIVGEGGSGLLNCLFSKSARVVCLRPIDNVPAEISALRGHEFHAVYPASEGSDAYSVDVGEVAALAKSPTSYGGAPTASGGHSRMRALNAALIDARTRAQAAEATLLDVAAEKTALATRAFWPFIGALLALSRFWSRVALAAGGVRRNPLFDATFYLDRYPFVRATGMDPYAHYLKYGAASGLDPSADFDTDWYLCANPDVAAAGVNPLDHYVRDGRAEGRSPRPGVRSI